MHRYLQTFIWIRYNQDLETSTLQDVICILAYITEVNMLQQMKPKEIAFSIFRLTLITRTTFNNNNNEEEEENSNNIITNSSSI